MPLSDITYTLRLRNAADSADDLTITSNGTNPYLAEPPEGDGFGIDIITGSVEYGSYTALIADAEISPGIRVVTEKLADVNGQYDKLSRRVIVEKSINGAALERHVAGYLTNISFPDEITAQLEFGDGNRAASTREIFAEAIGAFDRGTSLIGGPIRGGFAGMEDYGPWRMKVTVAASGIVTLRFVRGPVPRFATGGIAPTGGFTQVSGSVPANVQTYLNARALAYAEFTATGWVASGLIARLAPVGGGTVTYETPLLGDLELFGGGVFPAPKLIDGSSMRIQWTGTLPAVNDEFDVYVTPLKVSAENPLHVTGHAIDIQTAIWDEANEAWDATAAADTKAAIGHQRAVFLSIDKPWVQDTFETLMRGVFGYSYEEGPAGEKVLKVVRRKDSALPSVTITEAEQLGDEQGDIPDAIFELDESTIVNKVTVVQTIFRPVSAAFAFLRLDYLTTSRQEDSVTLDGSKGDHAIVYEIPGMVVDTFALGFSYGGFGPSLAAEILSRFGYGCPSIPLVVSHAVVARIGDSLILDVDHQINGNARGGSRIIQVVHRTEMEDGVALECLDGGLTGQVATTPTFTLAASGTEPKRFFSATITNAATLAAAGYIVRAEWGIGGSAPANGALLALVDPATITVIDSPRVDAGSHVWVRMRAEHPDQRPTSFSSWSGLDLADLTAPTSLTQTANVLDWTTGEGPQEVLWRIAAESVDISVGLLPAGANHFDLTAFVPVATSIVATVRSKDEPPYAGVSSSATLTFTTASAGSLTAPSAVSVSVVTGDTDFVSWTAAGNPIGTDYHIERSIVSSSSDFVEIGVMTDGLNAVVTTSYTTDSWFRVNATKAGYSPTAYSSVYHYVHP